VAGCLRDWWPVRPSYAKEEEMKEVILKAKLAPNWIKQLDVVKD